MPDTFVQNRNLSESCNSESITNIDSNILLSNDA